MRGPLIQRKATSLVTFLLLLMTKKVARRFSGGSFGFDLDLHLSDRCAART
jgi:hypothetical protein